MPKKNGIPTVRINVTVDHVTSQVVTRMMKVGFHGQSRSEVVAWIIKEWIWHNQDALSKVGVELHKQD